MSVGISFPNTPLLVEASLVFHSTAENNEILYISVDSICAQLRSLYLGVNLAVSPQQVSKQISKKKERTETITIKKTYIQEYKIFIRL